MWYCNHNKIGKAERRREMPARPLIQARSLLRGGRASKVLLPARSAIAPVPVPLPPGIASRYCRGYHISSRLLASPPSNGAKNTSASHSNTSSNSGASQKASVSVSGWSSGSVLAVAAAAAITGWGLSSFVPLDTRSKKKNKGKSNQDDDVGDDENKKDRRKEHVLLADNDDGEVGFANRTEMQEVS